MAHPAISLAAVLGVPDEEHGEEIKAFVVLKGGASVSSDDIIAWAKNEMAGYKYPRIPSDDSDGQDFEEGVAGNIGVSLKIQYDIVEVIVENYCGLKCVRADNIHKSDRITSDIWRSINESRFAISDLTGRNPNVFYEIEMAHARNKPVILLAQTPSEDIPFDLKEIRYGLHNLREFRRLLPEYIKNAISTIPQQWDVDFRPPDWNGS